MGSFRYGSHQIYQFDDRTLAHLRDVITSKLLKHESFLFTWNENEMLRSIWLHPCSSIEYAFEGRAAIPVNRSWIKELASLANGPTGLHLVSEPVENDSLAHQ